MTERLRVGVLLDSSRLRAWQRLALERIRGSSYAEIVWYCVREAAGTVRDIEPLAPRSVVVGGLGAGLFDKIYRRLERGIVCERDAFEICDGTHVLAGTLRIDSTAHSPATTPDYPAPDRELMHRMRPDVILDFGSAPPPAELCALAPYGVWDLECGDHPRALGAPPGFWEVYHCDPVTRIGLFMRTAEKRRMLAWTASGTHPLSLKLNRSNAYWNALSLIPRTLAKLHREGGAALETAAPMPPRAAIKRTGSPGVLSLGMHVIRNLTRRAKERLRRTLDIEQWILLWRAGDGLATTMAEFTAIVPPIDRYWADPHVIRRNGRHYIFLEEYLHAAGKGHIAVMTIDETGRTDAPVTIIERPYHLSYPFVFEDGDALYMVPESMQNGTVELYRCEVFPHRWTFVRNLLENIRAVDSTLVRHGGRWWLFANVLENEGGSASEELFLFHTESLLGGEWVPHVLNPIVSDVTRARPAGAIQKRGGKLFRPAQDCSVRYGYAIRINEITELSQEEYAEREVAAITPGWQKNILATHTLAHAAGLTVVDALLLRPRFGQHP